MDSALPLFPGQKRYCRKRLANADHGVRIAEIPGKNGLFGQASKSSGGGELRLGEAIPLIIKKLHEDDEILDPDCMRALVNIGTDQVVDALADDFPKAEWGFRFSAVEVLEKIHSDRTIERCVTLLVHQDDIDFKRRLCQALLSNFADEGIDPARQLILESELDPELVDVRRDLLNACMLMDREIPELEQWKQEAEHDVEFRKRWYAEHFPLSLADDEEDWHLEDDYEDYDDEPPPEMAVREQRKIGRNDPCPCGSGKKYKKCCLKTGNGAALFE